MGGEWADRRACAAGQGQGAAGPGACAAGQGQGAAGPGAAAALPSGFTAPGWERDENGALRRVKIARMGRRLPGFDYSQRRIYEITVVLEERRPVLGRLVKKDAAEYGRGPDGGMDGVAGEKTAIWAVEPSALGEVVLACWREIPARWPQVELIESQLMPDHFHGVLFVKERLPLTRPAEAEGGTNRRKTLGDIIRGFKAGCFMGWRAVVENSAEYGRGPDNSAEYGRGPDNSAEYGRGPNGSALAAIAAGLPRWAEGFVDTILFGKGQLTTMIAYLRDNPRRLGVKRERPELFKVRRDLRVAFTSPAVAPWAGPEVGHFAAIGNHFLLARPVLHQVQCSRRFFAYARDARGNLLKDAPPAVSTPAFDEKLDAALVAAKHGAVIVSPCISHGEREIARRVFAAGGRVVTLAKKGFSPLYKPGGKAFETCADGRLLLLAPIAWPYQPAEKPMTRDAAQTLNRIAQLIVGEGALEIDYKGAVMHGVDAAVIAATTDPSESPPPFSRNTAS